MQITHPHTLLILAWLAISQLCAGCSAEDITAEAPTEMGVLCLSLSSGDEFVRVETRAEQSLTDWSGYTFTLNDGTPISFTDGKAIIPAGTYTLSATNSTAVVGGYTGALYEGSTSFTLNAGELETVELALGAPKNAKVTVTIDETFSNLYTFSSLALNDGTKTNTIESIDKAAFFPATTNTTLTYTLTAAAKKDSHVQDITNATGTVTIEAGKHTTITLGISPIDNDLIIIPNGGTHTGEFQ